MNYSMDLSILKLKQQECDGDYKFSSKAYMTRGFIEEFGEGAATVAIGALDKVLTEYVYSQIGADYLQVFEYSGVKFWLIDDITHITFLLPEEY